MLGQTPYLAIEIVAKHDDLGQPIQDARGLDPLPPIVTDLLPLPG